VPLFQKIRKYSACGRRQSYRRSLSSQPKVLCLWLHRGWRSRRRRMPPLNVESGRTQRLKSARSSCPNLFSWQPKVWSFSEECGNTQRKQRRAVRYLYPYVSARGEKRKRQGKKAVRGSRARWDATAAWRRHCFNHSSQPFQGLL